MTALMAAGVGRGRIVAPVMIAAIVVVLVAAVNRELVIPKYREELSRQPGDLTGSRPRAVNPCIDNQTDIRLSGKSTIAKEKRIVQPEFSMPAALRDYGKQLVADDAYCVPRDGERPSGYRLENVREPKNLDTKPSLFWDGRPILITYRDAPDWLKPNQCFLVCNVDFEQLCSDSTSRDFSSVLQMVERLHNPSQDFSSKLRVLIHMRIVHPLIDITLLFLGLPLIITRESRNIFIAMGLCMAVTTSFMGVVLAMQWLGDNAAINPALAAWAPLIIFVPIATVVAEPLYR
jgi:lipopolysaccharide export system permease protein